MANKDAAAKVPINTKIKDNEGTEKRREKEIEHRVT